MDVSRLVVIVLLGAWLPALADATCVASAVQGRLGWSVYFDQDMFVPGVNKDRDYTMGIGVEFFQDQGPLYLLGGLLRRVEPLVGFDRRCGRVYRSFLLGSVNFTPEDIGDPAPIFDDRPYASLLYLANKKVLADEERALGVELMVGVIGLNLADEVQTTLHGWTRDLTGDSVPEDPRGWRHQISDGGEPTLRLRLTESRRLAHASVWDLAGAWEANLGFQTDLSVGLSGRLGRLNSPFWSIPYDPINRGNFVPALGGDELYLWAAGRLRGVLYNALLQGQFRDSRVTVDSSDVRRLLWEAGIGVTKGWQGLQLTFSVNARGSDTQLREAPDEHLWGGLYLSRSFD